MNTYTQCCYYVLGTKQSYIGPMNLIESIRQALHDRSSSEAGPADSITPHDPSDKPQGNIHENIKMHQQRM